MDGDQDSDLPGQVGTERYQLNETGDEVLRYDAFSLVPLAHLGLGQTPSRAQLQRSSQRDPIMLAVLLTTEPLAVPELDAGIYMVHYRAAGVPQELGRAVREAQRFLAIAKPSRRQVEKSAEWRRIVSRQGYTNELLRSKTRKQVLEHVYLGEARLPESTASDQWIYRDAKGKFVAAQSTDSLAVRSRHGAIPNEIHQPTGSSDIEVRAWIPVHKKASRKSNGRKWRSDFRFVLR